MDKDNKIIDKRGFDYTRIEEEFIDSVDEFDTYEKVIYVVLCRHANIYTATAFPSYTTICKKASCCRKKAIVVVQSLVDKGIINKVENVNAKGENTSNTYEILGYKNRNLYRLPPKEKKVKKDKPTFNNFENRKYTPEDIENIMKKMKKGKGEI